MTELTIVNCLTDAALPGALFADARTYAEFAPDRRLYEAALATFAAEASPAALRQFVATMRRYGIHATLAAAREAAISGLRDSLLPLGYTEAEIQWHAARRGRRDGTLCFANARLIDQHIVPAPEKGGWRGPYNVRRRSAAH